MSSTYLLIEIYNLITKLQKDIGDGARITLAVNSLTESLEIRIDWEGTKLHAYNLVAKDDLAQVDDEIILAYITDKFKRIYNDKLRSG